jgi:hypothetical protein
MSWYRNHFEKAKGDDAMDAKVKRVVMGKEYRDTVLGIQGRVIAICKYVTGCDHAELAWAKDNEIKSVWVDVVRLEPVKKNAPAKKAHRKSRLGGPANHPPSQNGSLSKAR